MPPTAPRPTAPRPAAPRAISRFLRQQDGSATAETVIWLPIFALLLGLITDTSMIFGGRAEALRVVQDANRALSVGHLMTTAAAEDYVLRHIAALSANGTVDTNVINGVISTRLTIPAADLTATGMFDGFATLNILIVAQHLSES